jgi:hypothetical protein
MAIEPHLLSKSTFMYGAQCLKRLWLHKYQRDLRDELDAQQQAIFTSGTNVGELAQKLFPGGVDCTPETYYDFHPSIARTIELIAHGHPVIYEAAFQHDRVLAALDILVLREDGWHGYEVKSTNDTKPTHIKDAALQYWVITGSGVPLKSINVLHFNREYVRVGELDIHGLFVWDDVTAEVLELQDSITEQVAVEKACLASNTMPEIAVGPHCTNPYPCDFMGHCWKNEVSHSVFNLTRGGSKAQRLFEDGITELTDIPNDFPLSWHQRIQVDAAKSGEPRINREGIQSFLDGLTYPLYFLDFETIMPGVPIFEQTRPYQQVVFQYSLHIQHAPGDEFVENHAFLADPTDMDMRNTLMDKLLFELSIIYGAKGTILVYNQSFEVARLKEAARDLPHHADTIYNEVLPRIVDLAVPFQRKDYYAPEMNGSYSIKAVLPALVPELSYSDLEIQEGGTASLVFLQMVQGSFMGDVISTRNALERYCELDTWGMVRIMERLYQVAT